MHLHQCRVAAMASGPVSLRPFTTKHHETRHSDCLGAVACSLERSRLSFIDKTKSARVLSSSAFAAIIILLVHGELD